MQCSRQFPPISPNFTSTSDPSDDPTPSPHPLSQGGKKNTKSYVLLVVSVCVLGIIAIVVTKVVWQRRNGYRRQGDDFEDEHTIAMFGIFILFWELGL